MRRKALPPEAVALYRSGTTAGDLAARYGMSPQSVLRRLRESGAQARGRGTGRQTRRPLPIDDELRALADGSRSTQEMADLLGVSAECAREHLVRLGIGRLAGKARPDRNHFWRGGRSIDADGYVLLKRPDHPHATKNGYVREHRLVMEAHLGRYLSPSEVVDHIDRVTDHNDMANLRLFASNGEHLAATLAGRVPNWTPDGRQRIAAGVRRAASMRAASRSASGNDGRQ